MDKVKFIYSPFIAAFLISFTLLFLFSPDSYTHDLYGHYDSAWFFTCGKAWMNGLNPYVDFADSKGPLLWLIYGIGYLISPYTYIGVFWLSVLLYTGVLYLIFRTAMIFLHDKKASMMVTIMMSAAFFCPWYHNEIRAEDWCSIFIVFALYRTCHTLYAPNGMKAKEIGKTCYVMGLALAGTLLIKFNTTLMLGTTALYLLYALIREKKNIFTSFLWVLTGFLSLSLPIVVYLALTNNFGAFIQEYFLNTMQTVQSYNGLRTYIHEWLFLTYDPHYVILFTTAMTGAWLMEKTVNKYHRFFAISFIGFYAIAIHHSSFLHWHYLSACMFFIIWICIYLTKMAKKEVARTTTAIVFAYTLISNVFSWGYVSHTWFFSGGQEKKSYYEAASYISQIDDSKIMYYYTLDNSQGVPSHCLPATKYWASQMGATKFMDDNQDEAVREQKADFIITDDHIKSLSCSDSLFRSHGYHQIYCYSLNELNFYLYSKHNLEDRRSTLHYNSIDILLKRNILNK